MQINSATFRSQTKKIHFCDRIFISTLFINQDPNGQNLDLIYQKPNPQLIKFYF